MGMQNSVTISSAMRSIKLLCGDIQSARFHSGWVLAHTRFMCGLRRIRLHRILLQSQTQAR